MKKIFLYILLAIALPVMGAPIDEAKALYNKGEYAAALQRLQQLVKKSPRDGSSNYWLGATLVAMGRNAEAIAPLEKADDRGVAEAALLLARIARDEYRPDEARDYYDSYEERLVKKKKSVPADIEEERRRTVLMENMMSRVEKIAVIDSIVVDAEDFFKAYRIAPGAGRLVSGAMIDLPDAEVAFIPQNETRILYSEPDSLGNFVLMGADILDDGSIDHPAPLPGDNLAGGGNAEYPFMLSDGMTLYFANDGDESLGGYDIFLTRPDDEGNFLQPQNIGMPYNSPYDDYLLAIDELTGLGWWATDRNRIPSKLTIYVFVPSETRVNVADDDENLIALATLSDISLTREQGATYPEIPEAVDYSKMENNLASKGKAEFALPVGSAKRIYTSISDFRSQDARRAMAEALNARAEINNINAELSKLRRSYANGDRAQADRILDLERNLKNARQREQNLKNKAIKIELSR
ncbi:MAG: tetratricopeptide repeat protein [Muribaculaceae bacterium]